MLIDYPIHIEDLPGYLADIAEAIGLSATLTLVRLWGGDTLYIPKSESVTRAARDRAIRKEFSGSNYSELAQKHGLSVSHIRSIVRQAGTSGKRPEMEQTEFWK